MGLKSAWNRTELSLQRQLGRHPSSTSSKIEALEKENRELRAEIAELKKKPRLIEVGFITEVRRETFLNGSKRDWNYYSCQLVRDTGLELGSKLYTIVRNT
jgi:cell division protein FtsB